MTPETRGSTDSPTSSLRDLFLFEGLSDDQLGWVRRLGTQVDVPAGTRLCEQGDSARWLWVLIEGHLQIRMRVLGDDFAAAGSSRAGVYGGATFAALHDPRRAYPHTLVASRPSRLLVLSGDEFYDRLCEWFPTAMHIVGGLFSGETRSQALVDHRKKLSTLGSVTESLTEELRGPAQDAAETAVRLRDRVAGLRRALAAVAADQANAAACWRVLADETDEDLATMARFTHRVEGLVGAAGVYTQLDLAPVQREHVAALLRATLLATRSLLSDVEVDVDIDAPGAPFPLHAAELALLWTSLVEEAVSAMNGQGRLRVECRAADGHVRVSFSDSGPQRARSLAADRPGAWRVRCRDNGRVVEVDVPIPGHSGTERDSG